MSGHHIIRKRFHFHAAHRNEDLKGDRCWSIHGHTYHLEFHFAFKKSDASSITMLFSEIEKRVMPIIQPFEHSFIINRSDPLYDFMQNAGMKLCVLDRPSSAENLAQLFYERIQAESGLNLIQVDLQETSKSIVSYREQE